MIIILGEFICFSSFCIGERSIDKIDQPFRLIACKIYLLYIIILSTHVTSKIFFLKPFIKVCYGIIQIKNQNHKFKHIYNYRDCKVKNTSILCEKEVLQDYEMQEKFLINLK